MAIIKTGSGRHSVAPTLNLDFANSKALDPRITFHRNSIATYYDSTGNLRYATHNQPRFDHDPLTGESKGLLIEGSSTNIFDYPFKTQEQSNAGIIANYAVAPDGKATAAGLFATTNSAGAGYAFGSTTANAGTYYSHTVYIKANDCSKFLIERSSYAGWTDSRGVKVDLTTETITSITGADPVSMSLTNVGKGWYKVQFTIYRNGTGSSDFLIYPTDLDGVNDYNFSGGLGAYNIVGYVWGIQIEAKPYSSSYIPPYNEFASRSTVATYYDENGLLATAARDTPRYGYKYDGRKWVDAGMIVEKSATNLFKGTSSSPYSGGFAMTHYVYGDGDGTLAPDGLSLAPKVVPTGTSVHYSDSPAINDVSPGDFTASIFLKSAGETLMTMYFIEIISGYTQTPPIDFDLATGTTSSDRAYMEKLPNGWYRCVFTATLQTGVAPKVRLFARGQSYAANGVDGYYYWGLQVETGNRATSYIPTYSAKATRAEDILTQIAQTRSTDTAYIDGKAFDEFYNQEEGSMFVNYQLGDKLGQMRVMSLSDGTSANYIDFIAGYGTDNQVTKGTYMFGTSSGESGISASTSSILNVRNANIKFAGRIKFNDYYGVTNNDTEVGTDTNAGVPVVNQLTFGNYDNTESQKLNGWIRKVSYYSEALSNEELKALSENN